MPRLCLSLIFTLPLSLFQFKAISISNFMKPYSKIITSNKSLGIVLVERHEEFLEHVGEDSVSGDVDADSMIHVVIEFHVGVLTNNV